MLDTEKPIYRTFEVELDDDDLRNTGFLLARRLREKGLLEKAESKRRAAAKLEIDRVQDAVDRVQAEILTGRREMEVPCYEVPAYNRNEVDLVRSDTGEVVESRPMTDADRQEDIPFTMAMDDEPRRMEPDGENSFAEVDSQPEADVVPLPPRLEICPECVAGRHDHCTSNLCPCPCDSFGVEEGLAASDEPASEVSADAFEEDAPRDLHVAEARRVVEEMEQTARAKPRAPRRTKVETIARGAIPADDAAFLGD